jgi:hypothetical protein
VVNGRPGDDPLADVVVGDHTVFTPGVDDLIRQVARLSDIERTESLRRRVGRCDPASPGQVAELERELTALLASLRTEAVDRGWEIEP